jgi:hypothetical protein
MEALAAEKKVGLHYEETVSLSGYRSPISEKYPEYRMST